ncbi:alpha/beta-hydrolase family protein [Brooklawnia cerclae]|uniref:Membrane protein n=1 Tax=Brooklawnia cerclae TaxID=349934 RepID=A0ABX0SJ50_9ACTN|nr:alpha/beta-hydrolase family protein [Brooklawnia cerclae]NIH58359.1 putative membrane protein [Brooklawnia cerclae]
MRLHNPFSGSRLIGRNGVILHGGRLRPGRVGRTGKTLAAQVTALTVPEVATGIAGYAASYTPSLLPRPWYFQGLVAGIGAMSGYQLGLLATWLAETVAGRFGVRIKPGVRRGGIAAGAAVAGLGMVAIPLRSIRWHRQTAAYVRHPGPDAFWAVASAGAASGVFWLFLAQWRLTLASINILSTHLHNRFARDLVARAVSTLVVLATILVLLDQVILRGVVGVATTASAQVDLRTPPNVFQPTTPLHSGSGESLEPWDSLGLQGKRFTCAGPTLARVAEVMAGLPAASEEPLQPIRAYASMNGRTLPEVVDAVLAELDRTGAWERKAILVVTTTGRGNVNEWSTSAFEYLMRGDSAVAAMQYSGLPSAVTMISSKAVPVNASQMLFAAIEERVASLPESRRPKLYVAGESLGAFGSNGIFESPDDLFSRAAGGVWTGCPGFTPLQSAFTRRRSPDSTQVWPVVDDGRHVRFATTGDHLVTDPCDVPFGPWDEPRFVYLQNDTDPVVWWAPKLLWRKPEWMDEMRGTNTPMGRMTWVPVITFWQIAADMPVCRSIGAGYGHKYAAEQCVPAWAGVLGLDPATDWTPLLDALNTDVPPVAP